MPSHTGSYLQLALRLAAGQRQRRGDGSEQGCFPGPDFPGNKNVAVAMVGKSQPDGLPFFIHATGMDMGLR